MAEAVARGEYERGIVLGGSGNGEAIVANRVRGIRCGVCWSEQTAVWSRAHNDANCLSIGQRTVTAEEALEIVADLARDGVRGRPAHRADPQDRRSLTGRRPPRAPAGQLIPAMAFPKAPAILAARDLRAADLDKNPTKPCCRIYAWMHYARTADNRILDLFRQGLIKGTVTGGQGNEG